jgi:hypothetical protein
MPLSEYVEYTFKLVKHGRSGLGSAFNRQAYFLTTASVEEMRYKADDVFHEAAVKLNKMVLTHVFEDMCTAWRASRVSGRHALHVSALAAHWCWCSRTGSRCRK